MDFNTGNTKTALQFSMRNWVSLGRKRLLGIISEVAARAEQEKQVHICNSTVYYSKLSCNIASQKAEACCSSAA